MARKSFYIINGITFYRLLSAPLLIFLVFTGRFELFKWLLALSFFTDAIDGFLARYFKIVSVLGAKIDSIADDVTVASAIIGMIVFNPAFLRQHTVVIAILLILYLTQITIALAKFRKLTSFHTYVAKVAAVLQGLFLMSFFFFKEPSQLLFYIAMLFTALDLIEEIAMALLLKTYHTDVKGLYWVLKEQKVKV